MKAKVTFYVMPSNLVEVSEVVTDPIEVAAQEKLALEMLCSGARGFKDENTLNFGLIDPSIVLRQVLDGSQDVKDAFMLDPDTADRITEDEFTEWFSKDYAELILERAADMLTGKLSDYYFAEDTFTSENADGELVSWDILPLSFISVSFLEDR